MSSTYLITWNPLRKDWPNLSLLAEQTTLGFIADEWWNVSNKGIVPGDQVFLLKQGTDLPTGVMGVGNARTASTNTRRHWLEQRANSGDEINFIEIDWEVLLNPEHEPLLPEAAIHAPGLPERLWNSRNSGNAIDPRVAHRVNELFNSHVEAIRPSESSIQLGIEWDDIEFPEGAEVWRLHRSCERHPELPRLAKQAALARDGRISCSVCEFDFLAKYGELGRNFIECHHTIPLSELKTHTKTRIVDVALVCSNCHRMLHRRRPWLIMSELKSLLNTA